MKIWAGYTNHRGHFNPERPIVPLSLRFGTSQWHRKPQWLMLGVDVSKGEKREFATADMTDVRPSPTWLLFTLDTIRQVVTRLEEITARKKQMVADTTLGHIGDMVRLADECLKELSKNRADEPIAYPPADILYVPATDVFSAPDDIKGPLGIHPGTAIKFAYMARCAGVEMEMSAEAELAYVQWQALQCWLTDRGNWRALFQERYNALVERAREIAHATNGSDPSKVGEAMPHSERALAELASMKNKSEILKRLPEAAKRAVETVEELSSADLLPKVDLPLPEPVCTCNFAIDSCPVHGLGSQGREDRGA